MAKAESFRSGGDDLLRDLIGNFLVAERLDGESALALRKAAQVGGVLGDLCEGNFRCHDGGLALGARADDAAAPLVDVAHDVAQISVGNGDLQLDDGLEQDGRSVFQSVLIGERGGELERHFRGVYVVIASVREHGFQPRDGIAREGAFRYAFAQSLFDGGDVLLGNCAADDFLFEDEFLFAGFEAYLAVSVLSVSARLLFVLAFGVGDRSDGLLVGDLRLCQRDADAVALFELFADEVEPFQRRTCNLLLRSC